MIHGLLCFAMVLAAGAAPDEAVARGRDALNRSWGGFPWYDSRTDGVRPIDVSKPDEIVERRPDASMGPGMPSALAGFLQACIWLMVAVVLVVVAFLLVRTYLLDDRSRVKRPGRTKKLSDHDRRFEALPLSVKASRLDLLAEARRYYQVGQYGEAVKYLFSYQLVELDKHRVLRLTRGKTNRQYLREVGGGARLPLGRTLEATMVVFEDFFFGNHPIDRARFEACWARLPDFEARLKGGTP